MKHAPIHAKSTRPSVAVSLQRPITGPNGASIAPPTYGIDFVDRQQSAGSGSQALDATIQLHSGESKAPQRQQENRTGLPDHLKAGVETLSGLSLDDVRVHYNSTKPAALEALAYTQGRDIHIALGQEQHLPHEAWHVVQQAQGRVQPTMQMKDGLPVNDDEGLEHEADVMGTKALGHAAQLQGANVSYRLLRMDRPTHDRATPIQRVFQPAVVTKPTGASLHKSDRKKKATAKVRSGGVFGTGLKVKVPNGATLEVDFDKKSIGDGQYLLAQFSGTTGYVNKDNVAGVDTIMTRALSLAAGLQEAFSKVAPVSLADLQGYIKKASQQDRDEVWKDKELMAKAKTSMPLDDYLALLPALGVFNPPTTKIGEAKEGERTSHFSAQEADGHIDDYLKELGVSATAIAGRKLVGEVSIVDDADWEVAFKRQWGTAYTPDQANAFVDVNLPKRHIWIHKDRGNAGTIIHEGMHKYADPTLRDDLIGTHHPGDPISQLDEGITEYFTRKVTSPLGITRGNYPDPHNVATALVTTVGEKTVADAYFEGKFAKLKTRYLSVKGNTWENFAGAVETKKWTIALSYL